LDILTIIFGLFGLVGAIIRNKCLLCIYSGQSVILLALGLGVGISAIVFLPGLFNGTTCSQPSNLTPFIYNFGLYYNQSYKSFATPGCPALYPNFASTYSQAQQAQLSVIGFTYKATSAPASPAYASAINSCSGIPSDLVSTSLTAI
jgi:hypothetical protein